VAYAPTIQSLGGHTFLSSDNKDGPTGLGYSYADTVSGLYGALAVLAALEYREKTGLGQYIDLSEYEAMCTLIGPELLKSAADPNETDSQRNRFDNILAAPYGCYPCLGDDRWCVIAVFNEFEWRALRRVMGNPSWAGGDNFSTLENRKRHSSELDQHIKAWTVKQTAEEVVLRLQEANVASGIVQNAEDLAKDPQLRARRFFKEIIHPVLGTTKTDRCPIMFKEYNAGPWKSSPLLGEHNQFVYAELLGLSEEEIRAYKEKGIIH
jgi:crotonobetainyl-CoA:carnitine CoA-transferase CaiB-like acyl-CoA transferase